MRVSLKKYVITAALLFACIQPAVSMPLSPESVVSLRASGRLAEVAAWEADARERGMDAPARNSLPALRALRRDDQDETIFRLPIILVDFDDNQANRNAHPVSYYERQCFSEGELQEGSGREWFAENSYGELVFDGQVSSWIRAPENYDYYVDGQNGGGDYPQNVMGLTEDAVRAADNQLDFSDFDNDGDGEVETVVIVHAGGGAEANGGDRNMIWSMAWGIWGADVTLDGVNIINFFVIPEDAGVGVICHEASHAFFGLPDLYDRDYSSEGLGMWTMMAAGSWGGGGDRPVHWDGWSKKRVGVTHPTRLAENEGQVSIAPIETDDVSYMLWNQGNIGSEYFLLENRQPIGFDESLPSSGLMIYHVDETIRRGQNDNEWYPGHQDDGHYLVALEQADADWDLERNANVGDSGDPYPGSSENRNFTDGTTPNTRAYRNDAQTRVGVRNISIQDQVVICDLEIGVAGDGPDIGVDPGALNFGDRSANERVDTTLTVTNTGNERLDVSDCTISGNDADQFAIVDGGGAFNLEPGAERQMTIRFNPTSVGEKSATLNISSNDPDENPRIVTLSGVAFGAPYITSPSEEPDYRVTFTEGDTIDLDFRAVDPEGGQLTWEMTNNGHLPNGVGLTQEEGSWPRLYWPLTRASVGRYAPIFMVSDPNGEFDQIRIFITVNALNNPPSWQEPVGAIVIAEDSPRQTLVDLDTLFTDPNGDSLTFTITDAPADLGATLTAGRLISVQPAANFNSESGVRITVSATDPSQASTSGEIQVVITPVNDAPGQTTLVSPLDGAQLLRRDESFIWNSAVEVDGDAVSYTLKLELNSQPVEILSVETGSDTSGVFAGLTEEYMISIGAQEGISGVWWVEASDGSKVTESAHRQVRIPSLGVELNPSGVPARFTISDGYPNPFNSAIRIEYALANVAPVKIAVYTLSGSLAATLVNGVETAGVRTAVWDARDNSGRELPGGIYLIHSEVGPVKKTIKAVLVR